MKKSKKLMILGLSAATAAVAATGAVSSFAWFASNYNVTATGMAIKASSNNIFLQIKKSTDSWDDTQSFTSAAAVKGGTAVSVAPTSAAKAIADNTITGYDGGATLVWANTSSDSVDAASKGADRTYADVTNVANPSDANVDTTYTLKNTFTLRLRPVYSTGTTLASTQPKAKNLTASVEWATEIKDFSTDPIANAVSVLVYTGTVGKLFTVNSATHKFVETATSSVVLASTMEAGESTKDVSCQVFVFIDGENTNCKTSNVKLENTYSVNVNFSVSDVTTGD